MTDKERDELLINMANDMKERDELLINMANDVKERDELLINMANGVKNLKNDMNNVKNDMKERDIILQNIVNEIKEIKEEQRSLSRTVAKIEVEHGEKLQILLDVVTGHEQKNKEFEKRFEEDEKILSDHDDEIFYLKEKIG